jgi:hypothetical protein
MGTAGAWFLTFRVMGSQWRPQCGYRWWQGNNELTETQGKSAL